ncbi:unnamed protein product [Camellia sinensis]
MTPTSLQRHCSSASLHPTPTLTSQLLRSSALSSLCCHFTTGLGCPAFFLIFAFARLTQILVLLAHDHIVVAHAAVGFSLLQLRPNRHRPLSAPPPIFVAFNGSNADHTCSPTQRNMCGLAQPSSVLLINVDADSATSSTLPSSSTVQRRLRTLPFQRDVCVGLPSTTQLGVGLGCMCHTFVVFPLLPAVVLYLLSNLWPI